MTTRLFRGMLVIVLVGGLCSGRRLQACPFCSSVSKTFSEEIESMDAAVIARLLEAPPAIDDGPLETDQEVPKAKFEIQDVIKGQAVVGDTKVIETLFFGEGKKGDPFLIMGVDPPQTMWTTPLKLTARGREYLMKLPSLPSEGTDRLRFFQQYLEDSDDMLARDAYDEFANAPYSEVRQLKAYMDRDKLVAWIRDTEIPASRRRLYLTMLGVCGTPDDLPMLEEMIQSGDKKSGLDALIACYLTLKGAEGMPLIEKLFLANNKAEYADTYAAIMALRFHASEGGVLPRERIVEGFRLMLDRPPLADLVIPDLARWEDWTQMEKLVELFKSADEKSSWVRVPVINYLRACPRPESKRYIEELEQIDPGAVKRARTYFQYDSPPSQDTGKDATSLTPPLPEKKVSTESQPAEGAGVPAVPAARNDSKSASSKLGRASEVPPLNLATILCVPLAVGSVLLVSMWALLRGAG